MARRRGKLSTKWGRYRGWDAPLSRRTKLRVEGGKFESNDGMADYVDGAEWWIAISTRNLRCVQRAFDRGDVASTLYEKTAAMIELGHSGTHYVLAVQLHRTGRDWDLDLTLSEIGIVLEELWDGESEIDLDKFIVP